MSDYMGQNPFQTHTRPAEQAINKFCVLRHWDFEVVCYCSITWPFLTGTHDHVCKDEPPLNHICQYSQAYVVPCPWTWAGPGNSILTNELEWKGAWLPKLDLRKLIAFAQVSWNIPSGASQPPCKKSNYVRMPCCEEILASHMERRWEERVWPDQLSSMTAGPVEAPAMWGKRPSWMVEPSHDLGRLQAQHLSDYNCVKDPKWEPPS